MEELTIFSNQGESMLVSCIYYFNDNNYYLIYTDKEIDENEYVVLHFVKVVCEVDPTTNTPQLYGVEITDDAEWKAVQSQIGAILEDKKNGTSTAVHYLEAKNLNNLKIKNSRTFRLRPDVMKSTFGMEIVKVQEETQQNNITADEGFADYKTKYLEQLNRIKELETELSEYKQKINDIKGIIE